MKITLITRDEETLDIEGQAGGTLMHAIRDAGVDELIALCAGALTCATCHVYVEDKFFNQLPPISEGESDLLDYSGYRGEGSRLSCQIQLVDEMDGMRVTIAPDD